MARRRKQNESLFITLVVVGAFVVLTIITILNPWSPIGIIFVSAVVGIIVVTALNFWNKMQKQFEQSKKFQEVSHVRSQAQMAFLTPTDFEHYIAMLFTKLGYKAEVTQQSGDGGIDIILRDGKSVFGVQVKRFLTGNVGRPDIQKLVGASLNRFDKMVFVTASSYSQGAIEYAQQNGVKLIDGKGVEEMSKKVLGPEYIHKALSYSILERK